MPIQTPFETDSATSDAGPDLPVQIDAQEDAQEDAEISEDFLQDDGGEFPSPDVPDIEIELPQVAECKATLNPPVLGAYGLAPAFTEVLSPGQLDSPVELVQHPTDDNLWYVANLKGTVVFFRTGADAAPPQTALDIKDLLYTGHPESGLVSLTFHPDFENTPYAYVSYHATVSSPFTSRLARFTVAPDGTFSKDSLTVIVDEPQPAAAHSGNQIEFGPDGFLYWVLGDGQNPGDPHGNGQNPQTRKGAVVRIDVDNPSDGNPYGIPADNPFVDGGGAPEVYAYGLRNPWRFSFDSQTGQLWVGDVGQDTSEEINEVVNGGNYGWPIMEGDLCYPANDSACDQSGLITPRVSLSHLEAASITCGHVYRGAELPTLTGKLIFADYASGAIWSFDPITGGVSLILESGLNIASFERARDESLYVVAYSSSGSDLYRLVPAEPSAEGFPTLLSATGCMDPENPALPGDGVHPYTLRSPLWSDGAAKERFMAVPSDEQIAVADDGDFQYPVGSVLIKHFGFGDVLHETRLLMHHETGWVGYSYEWNNSQTDAQLLTEGKTKELPNGVRWRYPTSGQCTRCHTAASGFVLGPEVAQFPPVEQAASPLDTLFELGLFEPEFEAVDDLPNPAGSMPAPHDMGVDLQARAKSYLHANCAGCHRPGGTSQAGIDLRWATPFADMKICDVKPKNGYLYTGNTDMRIVSPGIPDESILFLRMATLNTFRMPDLGTHVVDELGIQLVYDWVNMMGGCE